MLLLKSFLLSLNEALPSPGAPEPEQVLPSANRAADVTPGGIHVEGPEIASSSSTYGPVRRRCTGKQPDNVVYRPPEMRHEDLSELLTEIAIEDLTKEASNQGVSDETMNSPRGTSCKREASVEAVGHENSRPRNSETEALFCHDVLSCVPCNEIPS